MGEMDLNSLSADQLDEIMRTGELTPPPATEEFAAAAEPAAAEAAPEQAAAEQPAETPEPEPEIDWKARAEEYEAKLKETQAHASRLSGAKGFYEKKYRELAMGRGEAAAADDTSTDEFSADDSATQYELEAARSELQSLREERDLAQRRAEDMAALQDVAVQLQAVPLDIVHAVTSRHRADAEDVAGVTDPEVRANLRRALCATIISEAHEEAQQRRLANAQEQRRASTVNRRAAVSAQMPSAAGQAAPPAPRPRGLSDMSADDADRWLRENVR